MKYTHLQYIGISARIAVLSLFFVFISVAQASEITPKKVVELVNQDRASQNLTFLHVNDMLTRAAQAKADDMAKHAYFAHTSPSGVTPWFWIQRYGYDYRVAGENLAIRFTDAEDQEQAWMTSVKHRENILNPQYGDIGVAVKHTIQNGQEVSIVVQMFGSLSGVASPFAKDQGKTEMMQEDASNALIPSVNGTHNRTEEVLKFPEQSTTYFEPSSMRMHRFGFTVVLAIMSGGFFLMTLQYRQNTLRKKLLEKESVMNQSAI